MRPAHQPGVEGWPATQLGVEASLALRREEVGCPAARWEEAARPAHPPVVEEGWPEAHLGAGERLAVWWEVGCQAAQSEEAARPAHQHVAEGWPDAHLGAGTRLAQGWEVGCPAARWEEAARQAHQWAHQVEG